MAEPLTAQKLAEVYSEGARENYQRDGHIMPIVHILDGEGSGVSLLPNPERFSGQPREQLAALVAMIADIVDVVFVCTITEGWMKAFPSHDRDNLPDLQRGQLSKESETDPEVRTTAMVQAMDVRDFDHSYSIMSVVKGDPRDHEWDIWPNPGRPEGGMPDDVINAYHKARAHMVPIDHKHTLFQRVEFLGQIGFIAIGLIAEPSPERN